MSSDILRTAPRRAPLILAGLLAVLPAGAQPPSAGEVAAPAVATLQLPQSPLVERIRRLKPGAGRLDWAVQGDRIAYDARTSDGFYDLYVTDPEGRSERCLTCNPLEFRRAHAFNPTWHPSGQWLIFQVQPVAGKLRLDAGAMTTPDRGLHTELWLIRSDGQRFWQIAPSGRSGTAALDPQFSHEGELLAWSERVASRRGRWGEWQLRVARFELGRSGVPRLSHVRSPDLGEGGVFVQAHGFAPDDRQLVVSGNLGAGQPEIGMDLYLVPVDGGAPTPLTRSPGEWDEQGRISPSGQHLAWTSNRDLPRRPAPSTGPPSARAERRELWLMRRDGSDPQRLTFFNHPAAPESAAGAVVADLAWSPSGNALAIQVVTDLAAGEESIYLVELVPGLGREPSP